VLIEELLYRRLTLGAFSLNPSTTGVLVGKAHDRRHDQGAER